MIKKIKIGNSFIEENKTTIVAEISGNHGGKINNLKKLILKAKRSKCDAIKIQAYQADTITINSKKKNFLIKKDNTWKKYNNLFSLYKKAETPFKWYNEIFKYCRKIKITAFASVFDKSSVDLLEKLNCPAYKIASPEITDIPLISYVAKTKKPIILSNGLADLRDLKLAFNKSVNVNLEDSQLIVDGNKIKFSGFVTFNFIDLDDFYRQYQINKNYRKQIKKISFGYFFDLNERFIEIDNVSIDGAPNQNINRFLDKLNSKKENIFNKITFKNSIKNFFKNL